MKKSKSRPKHISQINRQNLINKISDAMKMKYNNFFTAANYDTKSLKEDIGKLLNTQYYSKDPRDVFKPIETNILDIVKKNNPQLQIKIKKAKKLPEIKYTKDKYQEADQLEKEKEKEVKNKSNSALQKNNNKNLKNNIKKSSSNINNKKENNNTNIIANENTINQIENKNQIIDINNQNEYNENNKKEEISNTMYRLQEEYGIKHTLVDQLNNRIKYDPSIKILDDEKKLYEKEQLEKKQKKIDEQKKYLNDLKIQIEERDKIKEEEKKLKLQEFEEIQKQIISEKEKLKQKQKDEQLKKEKIKLNYEKIIQEKNDIKNKKKLEEDKQNKLLFDQINEDIKNEKKKNIEKKNKIKEQILKTKEINEKLAKEKMNSEKEKEKQNADLGMEENVLFKPNSLSSNAIKERVNKRALAQEAVGNYLLKIINSLEKQNQDTYLVEREKQEQKKKLEYEIADKNRQIKLNDYKQSLLDTLAHKNLEKEKQKEEDEKYRKILEDEYAMYLKEEKEKKLKQIEKYENYRKALEEQIKENKIREIENMKYKYN